MPELPEVETVRRQLMHKVRGKTIASIDVHHPKTVGYDTSIAHTLCCKTICDIDRVGKLLIFSFQAEQDTFLLAHLKMTGQFFFVDKKQNVIGGGHSTTTQDNTNLPNRHTRVSFHFDDDTALHFNDMRLFGYTKAATASMVTQARSRFGPEPIDGNFDIETFVRGLKRRKSSIKAVLLDQSFVAGLGNIYVDEALHAAGIRPTRRSDRVTKKEAVRLASATQTILQAAIEAGGTTFQHFLDTGGTNGNYTDYLRVFGKQDTPCLHCGEQIKKIRCAGRGTHFCPVCQH